MAAPDRSCAVSLSSDVRGSTENLHNLLEVTNVLMARIENASEFNQNALQHTDSEIKTNDSEIKTNDSETLYTAQFKRQHLYIAALFVWIL